MGWLSKERQKFTDARNEVLGGITIFLAMSYIIFANPIVLSGTGIPPGAVLLGTCLVAAVGSISAGLYAMTPTAIAPAVGTAVLFAAYVQQPGATWQSGLLAGLIAGAAFVIISFWPVGSSTLRRKLLEEMPPAIRAAVISGIGALLATFSYQLLGVDFDLLCEACTKPLLAGDPTAAGFCERCADDWIGSAYDDRSELAAERRYWMLAFLAAVAAIAFNDLFIRERLRRIHDRLGDGAGADGPLRLKTFLSSLFPIATVVALTLCFHHFSGASLRLPPVQALTIVDDPAFWEGLLRWDSLAPMAFAIVLFVVLVSDIAGSPFDLLKTGDLPEGYPADERIDRGLRVDSIINLVAPFVGNAPAVYYAENRAGQLQDAVSGIAACVAGGLFLALALLTLVGSEFLRAIPPLAIAPILFYVGVYIVAASFRDVEPPEDVVRSVDAYDYLPAALTTIVTAVSLNVTYALAVGLVAYVARSQVRGETVKATTGVLTVALVVAAGLQTAIG